MMLFSQRPPNGVTALPRVRERLDRRTPEDCEPAIGDVQQNRGKLTLAAIVRGDDHLRAAAILPGAIDTAPVSHGADSG